MKRFLILILLLLPTVRLRLAADTHTAATCAEADVQAAYDAASDGDIVAVPAGECTWTGDTKTLGSTGLEMLEDKGVTLQGAGIGQTIILDSVPQGAIRLIGFPGRSVRITGFEFRRQAVESLNQKTVLHLTGATESLRIDNNRFDHRNVPGQTNNKRAIRMPPGNACFYGVIDHNEFYLGTASLAGALSLHGGSCYSAEDGVSYTDGNGAWVHEAEWGSSKFLFVEDNTFLGLGGNVSAADVQDGLRVVYRFNLFDGANGGCSHHGTESGGLSRAPRAIENYANLYTTTDSSPNQGQCRGGGILAHHNSLQYYTLWGVRNLRSGANFGNWPASDGTNAFDLNDGVTYESGVASAGTTAFTLVDTTKSWDVNEWLSYSIVDCNATSHADCAAGVAGVGSWIRSNTEQQIVIADIGTGARLSFAPGDNYIILRATKVFDAVGRGAGLKVSNGAPSTLPDGTTQSTPPNSLVWIEQEDEPVYIFANYRCTSPGCTPSTLAQLGGVADATFSNLSNFTTPHVRANRDVYHHNESFSGTEGVGYGTAAEFATHTTCTTGVAFWVTDEGNWNGNTDATWPDGRARKTDDGRLYKCTATNTWTLYYTPYQYPHPLASGGEDPPIAPTLTSISPTSATRTEGADAEDLTVTLTGTAFNAGNFAITVTPNTGITVSDIMGAADTERTAIFTLAADAPTTTRTVTVTTDDGTSAGQAFTVRAPIITGVSPAGVNQGTTNTAFTLTGTDLCGASKDVTFDPAADLTGDTENCSGSDGTFLLDVAAGATPGVRTLTWTTADGVATSSVSVFDVVTVGDPAIFSITPTNGYRGTTVNLTINGVNLTDATIAATCDGYSFSSTTVVSDALITTRMTIAADADLLQCNIRVRGGTDIAFVSGASNSGSADTVTIGTHSAGDFIFIQSMTIASGSACTVPDGWTPVTSPISFGTSYWHGLYYKVAEDDMETSGSWTGCTRLTATVYDNVAGIGNVSSTLGQSTDITFTGVSGQVQDTSSWFAGFHCHRTATTTTAPTGMTNRTAQAGGNGRCAAHDTNAAANSFDTAVVTANAANRNGAFVVELLGGLSNAVPFTPLSQHGAAGGAAIF